MITKLLERLPPRWSVPLRAASFAIRSSGLARSAKDARSVDRDGRPIPWYTFSAIAYLDRLDVSGLSVFEWGLGASTLYWERRGCEVAGVDHSRKWHAKVTAESEAECLLAEDVESYVAAPGQAMFDIVCIDGVYRDRCAAAAPTITAHGGMIVYDNSDRDQEPTRVLRDDGWVQVDFYGLGPLNPYPWTTSVFFRAESRIPHPDLPPANY